MEKDVTISARIPKKLAAQVNLLSKQYQRSRSWLVEEALRHYVVDEMAFIEAVEEGRKAFRRGDVVAHKDVVAEWQRRKRKFRQ